MTEYTAHYNKKSVYRGDTIDGMNVTIRNTEDDSPIIPIAICAQLRNRMGKLAYQFEYEINPSTGTVHILPVPPSITAHFSPGVYKYDIEYTLLSGRVRTYLSGEIEILGDVSRCHAT